MIILLKNICLFRRYCCIRVNVYKKLLKNRLNQIQEKKLRKTITNTIEFNKKRNQRC